jgi:uncharacterized hydrophobic protein (TIGR00271 family)
MLHLRIVVPPEQSEPALGFLRETDSVANLIHFEGVAEKPDGDVILCDVARMDTSFVINGLRGLGVYERGSIAMETIDSQISVTADAAIKAAGGNPSDAVVWEEIESRTSENVELSFSFLAFFVLSCLIAAVGILLDSPILIVGAMIVGPDFGPIAGLCVAIAQRRGELAARSAKALAIGFPISILGAYIFSLGVRLFDVTPGDFVTDNHPLTDFIAHPNEFSFVVAILAGAAGILSLTSAKSGALIGVLISVTTVPAASNIGVAAAYRDWHECGGAALQLGANIAGILVAGVLTLWIQRAVVRTRPA